MQQKGSLTLVGRASHQNVFFWGVDPTHLFAMFGNLGGDEKKEAISEFSRFYKK